MRMHETVAGTGNESSNRLADRTEISQAMLYKTIQERKEMDLVETEEGIRLTDAGKIARL